MTQIPTRNAKRIPIKYVSEVYRPVWLYMPLLKTLASWKWEPSYDSDTY